MTTPSTTVQWTIHLEDAALIHDTLLQAAESNTNSASYLESQKYADGEIAKAMAKAKADGIKYTPWELSSHDRDRIAEYRSKADRLYKLAGA